MSLEAAIFSKRFITLSISTLVVVLGLLVVSSVIFVLVWPESWLFIRFQVDVDNEGNWATWFSSTIDLLTGIVAFINAWLINRRAHSSLSNDAIGWMISGCVFIYLGMDDAAQIHEHTAGFFSWVIDWAKLYLPFVERLRWYIWIPALGIPGAIILTAICKFLYRNMWAVRSARWLLLAGFILFMSNPITEVIGTYFETPKDGSPFRQTAEQLYLNDYDSWLALKVVNLVQETSEMAGVICFLSGFLLFGESLIGGAVPLAIRPSPQ
jgi:hypothetical protein